MKLGTYSIGTGDRFALEGEYQLRALELAADKGIAITPVWNKSNREHTIVHSSPLETREAADAAVKMCNWHKPYFVDADHINHSNVDHFIDCCDFFTLDVAEFIGKSAPGALMSGFINANTQPRDSLHIPGIDNPLFIDKKGIERIASSFLFAIHQAAELYHYIESRKGKGNFIVEVSMDEVQEAQSPVDMYFILKELNRLKVPVDTIAPKFTGRFNKGVDYEGDLVQFENEFEQDMLVIRHAIQAFKMPEGLKLSVHSGSDKFSLYPIMDRLIKKYKQGIHLKTAGTTWLEELIGLAMAGSDALELAKNIYAKSLDRFDELCAPYSTVIDIDPARLPEVSEVMNWTGKKYADTLRHVPGNPDYNPHFRQLLHVAYKIAAEYSNVFIHHLRSNSELIGSQVTENLYDRHIRRLFGI